MGATSAAGCIDHTFWKKEKVERLGVFVWIVLLHCRYKASSPFLESLTELGEEKERAARLDCMASDGPHVKAATSSILMDNHTPGESITHWQWLTDRRSSVVAILNGEAQQHRRCDLELSKQHEVVDNDIGRNQRARTTADVYSMSSWSYKQATSVCEHVHMVFSHLLSISYIVSFYFVALCLRTVLPRPQHCGWITTEVSQCLICSSHSNVLCSNL